MYHQVNIYQFYVLPTQCIYEFCVDLRTNSDFSLKKVAFSARYGVGIRISGKL